MSAIKVPTNFNIELEFEIPEFYRRMVALIIDMVIEIFYIKIAWEIYKSVAYDNIFDDEASFNNQAIWMTFMLPIAFYHVIMEITMNGQSVGKRIMNLRVVDERGGKASFSQFMIRWLLRVSDLWIAILLFLLAYLSLVPDAGAETIFLTILGFAWLIVDIVLVVSSKKGQRIGDILAHTIIIRTNPRSDIEQTVFQEVSDSYVPAFPEIMKLSDKDINAIKSILETAKKKGDFNMAANASDKIKGHLKIDTTMSPFDFLETLLKDYNYLSTK